jgi:hypothetical protein
MDIRGCLFERSPEEKRNKKLIAGAWYSIHISDPGKHAYECRECPEKKRKSRNCRNRHGFKDSILLKHEWETASGTISPALKIGEVKIYECPVSLITDKTWKILGIINATTDADCNIVLPYKGGSYLEQPEWYKQAVKIVRQARATNQRLQAGKNG